MTSAFTTEVLLRGDRSDGRISIIENTLPLDFEGPSLHTHAFDEAFYVLEGELTLQVGDALVAAPAGRLAFAPSHVPHTLANLSGAPVRYLLICTPAGFERHFARLAATSEGIPIPDWALAPSPEVVWVGPPISRVASGAREPG